jgi:hypothetical protein
VKKSGRPRRLRSGLRQRGTVPPVRYVGEQAFRFSNRTGMTDSDRFDVALRQIVGKHRTWAEGTGKVAERSTLN